MSFECAKATIRRLHHPLFHQRVFVGRGLDIGCGDDPLSKYACVFPQITSVDSWDREQGDGQILLGVQDGAYDFVHSSHSLEHMDDPYASLKRWSQIIKHDGHIVITVPDFDLYEHTNWPSRFNGDHKHSFTLNVRTVDPCVISIFELVSHAVPNMEIIRAELIESTFDDVALGRIDQTQGRIAECAIELVLRK